MTETSHDSSARLARAFASLAVLGFGVALVLGVVWWRGRGAIELERLSPDDRAELLAAAVHANPGAFVPAAFEPRIVYTLRPNARVSAWDADFTANDLGYRAGPSQKAPGTFRVLFVGDSWTFGMGLSESEAFPRVFEGIANRLGAAGGRVEAWTLALPGYNPLQEIAALEYFGPRLEPDVVVLGLCSNDMDSAAALLPEGSVARSQERGDEFGDDHSLVYRTPLVDAASFRRRWARVFGEIRSEEARLAARKVPFFLYFIASWEEAFAHALVADAGLKTPYLVVPRELTVGKYRNPPPFRHGTAAANLLYAERLYRGISPALGWPPINDPKVPGDAKERPVLFRPPVSQKQNAERLLAEGAQKLAEDYVPGPRREAQCLGPMDCATGLVGRATTILVRRGRASARVRVELSRLAEVASIYPQTVEIWIESPSGGTRVRGRIEPTGPETLHFEIPLPQDIKVGTAIDLGISIERAAISPEGFLPRGFRILRVSQVPE